MAYADAAMKADSGSIPRNTTSMNVQGMSHAEHTLDSFGRFKHPFKHVEKEV